MAGSLFDMLGADPGAYQFHHTAQTMPGSVARPQGPAPMALPHAPAPAGTPAALAQYGPQITQMLQAAMARYRAQQMQQAAAATQGQQGAAVQGGIDAAAAARAGQQVNPGIFSQQPAFPPQDPYGLSGGGDMYMGSMMG